MNLFHCFILENVFTVRLLETDASKRCNLDTTDEYELHVETAGIKLRHPVSQTDIYNWPLTCVVCQHCHLPLSLWFISSVISHNQYRRTLYVHL